MERLVSKYKDNLIASKKKHIFARLLDYFSTFVVTYLLFTVFYAIGARLPLIDNLSKDLQNQNGEIAEYIDSTHLQRLNSDHSALLSIDDGAAKYVESLCKTSAYVHELTFPIKNNEGVFEEQVVSIEETFSYETNKYELDALSYYFKLFKKNDASLNTYYFDNIDYQSDIDTYQYLKIMKVDETKYVSGDNAKLLARGNGISHFVVLNEENTKTLLKYFKEDRANTDLYNEIYLNFINGAKYGINEVENHSIPYIKAIDSFNATYQSLILGVMIIYLISYTISYLALTLILRLISKEWITLGMKVLGLSISSSNELEPTVWQITIYHIFSFITFASSLIIAFYFMGMMGVLSLKVVGNITLLAIIVALLILNVISLVMPLFMKNNDDLASLATRLYIKDTKEFEGPIENKEEVKNEETNSGRDSEQ